jgi:hypothetical protein
MSKSCRTFKTYDNAIFDIALSIDHLFLYNFINHIDIQVSPELDKFLYLKNTPFLIPAGCTITKKVNPKLKGISYNI